MKQGRRAGQFIFAPGDVVADHPRRTACNNRACGKAASCYGACSDDAVIADPAASEQECLVADPDMVADADMFAAVDALTAAGIEDWM